MMYANQKNLARCMYCDALYDKTTKFWWGYYQGTSNYFKVETSVREGDCPICGKTHKEEEEWVIMK
jgi:uncharacterized Zn-finger protein